MARVLITFFIVVLSACLVFSKSDKTVQARVSQPSHPIYVSSLYYVNAFSGGYIDSVYLPNEEPLRKTAQRRTDREPKI
jgi:hypothetical protein